MNALRSLVAATTFYAVLCTWPPAQAAADPDANALRAELARVQAAVARVEGTVGQVDATPAPTLPPEKMQRLGALREELARLDAKDAKLREAIKSGAVDPEVVAPSIASLDKNRAALRTDIETIEAEMPPPEPVPVRSHAERLLLLEQRLSELATPKPAPPVEMAAPSVAAPPSPAPAGAAPTARLPFGKDGSVQVQTLVQAWFAGAFDSHFAKAAGTQPYFELGDKYATFRLRRAELKVAGDVSAKIGFVLMLDGAKTPDVDEKTGLTKVNAKLSLLQDAVLTFRHVPYAHISIGQAKMPLSLEGQTSSAQLLFAERSEVGRAFGDVRDLGLWVHYKFSQLAYRVGVFNGGQANQLDNDKKKDLAARLETFPVRGLTLAAAMQRTLAGGDQSVRTAYGADARFEFKPCLVHGEYYARKERDAAGVATRAHGAFIMAACRAGIFQPAARFDAFDPNRDAAGKEYWRLTLGLNLLVGRDGLDKVQLNYIHTGAQTSAGDNNLVLLAAQSGF